MAAAKKKIEIFDMSQWVCFEPVKYVRGSTELKKDEIRVKMMKNKEKKYLKFIMDPAILEILSADVHGKKIRLFHNKENFKKVLLAASPSGYKASSTGASKNVCIRFRGPDSLYAKINDFCADVPFVVHKKSNGSLSSIEINLENVMEIDE